MNTKRVSTIVVFLALLAIALLLAACGAWEDGATAPTPWPTGVMMMLATDEAGAAVLIPVTATATPLGWTPAPLPPATPTPAWTPPPDYTPPSPLPTVDPTRVACASAAVDAGATWDAALAACYPAMGAMAPTGIPAPPTPETIAGCATFVASAEKLSHMYYTGQATEAAALEPTHVALWPTCEAAQTMEAAAP